jgi:outer membrane murein-binding lipoprotein Lpp
MGVKVDIGTAVSVGTTLAAGTHEAKIKAISKTVKMFLIFIDTLFCKELPNG